MGEHVLDVLDRIDEVLDDHAAGVFAEAMDSIRDLIDGSVHPDHTAPFVDCDCPSCDWSEEPTTAARWTAEPGDQASDQPEPDWFTANVWHDLVAAYSSRMEDALLRTGAMLTGVLFTDSASTFTLVESQPPPRLVSPELAGLTDLPPPPHPAQVPPVRPLVEILRFHAALTPPENLAAVKVDRPWQSPPPPTTGPRLSALIG